MTSMQGKKANESGKGLENAVEAIISSYDIPSVPFSKIGSRFGKKIINSGKRGFLVKNVPYKNMYGSKSSGEFVLQHSKTGPIRIECRYQDVAGSVDEKMPYLVGNCLCFKEDRVILVLDGKGMRSGAKEYVKSVTKSIRHKDIKVMSLNQFSFWAKKVLGQE